MGSSHVDQAPCVWGGGREPLQKAKKGKILPLGPATTRPRCSWVPAFSLSPCGSENQATQGSAGTAYFAPPPGWRMTLDFLAPPSKKYPSLASFYGRPVLWTFPSAGADGSVGGGGGAGDPPEVVQPVPEGPSGESSGWGGVADSGSPPRSLLHLTLPSWKEENWNGTTELEGAL